MTVPGGDVRREMEWEHPGDLCLSFLGYLLVPDMGFGLQIQQGRYAKCLMVQVAECDQNDLH